MTAIERLRSDVAMLSQTVAGRSGHEAEINVSASVPEIRALLAVADAAKVLDGNLDRYENADSKLWGQLEDLSAALDALEALP